MTRPGKIVSGGQTGVDRAALDVAIKADIPHGGWCPAGRKAEDGLLAPRYQLTETDSAKYRARTRLNVRDSDGTLILARGELTGGTALTKQVAEQLCKPYLVIDLDDVSPGDTVETFHEWLQEHAIHVLNIAGPRESQQPGIYDAALALLRRWLADHSD